MNYPGPQYTFSPEHGVHFGHPTAMHYPQSSQAQHMDGYFPGNPHGDFTDFGHHALVLDDYEDGVEASTRPRLTKDQVDVLESQFQAQPKPNSNVKLRLAVQTKLTLPRVANWFQNRRAKAKQQKKLEEFEIKRALGMVDGWKSEGSLPSAYPVPLQLNTTETSTSSGGSRTENATSPANAASGRNSAHDASLASLHRALSAADAAQSQRAMEQEREQSFTAMPPPPMPLTDQVAVIQPTSYSEWTPEATSSTWPLSLAEDSLTFDFGFNQPEHLYSGDRTQSQNSLEASSVSGFTMPADDWSSTVHTPTVPNHPAMHPVDHGRTTFSTTQPIDIHQPTTFSPHHVDTAFQLPQYPASRRGSSDELTSNFVNFALVSTPPLPSPLRTASDLDSCKRKNGEVGLAARRKGPRPAELGIAALRSRSYGAPSMSPTFRLGNHSPISHPVRHAKSVGHNLNVRYSGVRKPSSAQRSPLNVATFAEAGAFRELGQSQMMNRDRHAGTTPPTPVSSDEFVAHQFPIHEDGLYSDQDQHTPHQFYFHGHPVNFNMASPPSTPFKADFYPAHLQTTIPPLSAPPQYAVFPDHTPPYSAGPLTSSSWSDGHFGLTETAYPTTQVMYPTAQDFNNGVFQNFSAPPQPPKPDMAYGPNAEQKQTEFCIQEFPRQKEEHARAAQRLAQQKPKNYVFENATPNDF